MKKLSGRIFRVYSKRKGASGAPLHQPKETSCTLLLDDVYVQSASSARCTTPVHKEKRWKLNITVGYSISELMAWWAIVRNGEVRTFSFGYMENTTLRTLTGDGFPTSISLQAGVSGIPRFTIEIQGTGPLTQTPFTT